MRGPDGKRIFNGAMGEIAADVVRDDGWGRGVHYTLVGYVLRCEKQSKGVVAAIERWFDRNKERVDAALAEAKGAKR